MAPQVTVWWPAGVLTQCSSQPVHPVFLPFPNTCANASLTPGWNSSLQWTFSFIIRNRRTSEIYFFALLWRRLSQASQSTFLPTGVLLGVTWTRFHGQMHLGKAGLLGLVVGGIPRAVGRHWQWHFLGKRQYVGLRARTRPLFLTCREFLF